MHLEVQVRVAVRIARVAVPRDLLSGRDPGAVRDGERDVLDAAAAVVVTRRQVVVQVDVHVHRPASPVQVEHAAAEARLGVGDSSRLRRRRPERARGSPCRCRRGCECHASRRSCPRARSWRRAGRRVAGRPSSRSTPPQPRERVNAPIRRPARSGKRIPRAVVRWRRMGRGCSGSRSKGGTLAELPATDPRLRRAASALPACMLRRCARPSSATGNPRRVRLGCS